MSLLQNLVGTFGAPQLPLPEPPIPEHYLRDMLRAEDDRIERRRVNDGGFTHVSSLVGLCTRSYVLSARFGNQQQMAKAPGSSMRLVWKIGRAVERHIRDQLLAARNKNGIYGVWKCLCRKHSHTGFYPANLPPCEQCGTRMSHYHEVTLFDHTYYVVGNPDLVMQFGAGFFPIEIKSMDHEKWDVLEAPLGDHIDQNLTYRRLMQLQGMPVRDQIGFIYASKRYRFGSPYKDFYIDATEPGMVARADLMLSKAMELRQAFLHNTLPPRIAQCGSPTTTTAKNCHTCGMCFNMGN